MGNKNSFLLEISSFVGPMWPDSKQDCRTAVEQNIAKKISNITKQALYVEPGIKHGAIFK